MLDNKCTTLVKEVDGSFYLFCETLGLVTKGPELSGAYHELQDLRRELLGRFKEMGITPPQPNNRSEPSVQKRSYSFPKLLMVLGICLVFLIGIGTPVFSVINRAIASMQSLNVKLVSLTDPTVFSARLANAANFLKEVTPQRKKELHENLRAIVSEMEPFVDDVRPLIFEPQNSKSTK